jgi:hypothetical protein
MQSKFNPGLQAALNDLSRVTSTVGVPQVRLTGGEGARHGMATEPSGKCPECWQSTPITVVP